MSAKQHRLAASVETVRVGLIDRDFPPVLEIVPGDEVDIETWSMWGGAAGPDTTMADVRVLRERHAGSGPHSLTGPIAVTGARPGDVLRIDVLGLALSDHGMNLCPPGATSRGILAERFPDGFLRHFRLDAATMTTELKPGLRLPLRPFLGIMGVAPAEPGSHSSVVPGPFGGNIDCPDLVVGSSFFLPVFADGALFYAGDAHASQGCGEVDQTAIETAFPSARLRFSLSDEPSLTRPRAETPEHYITMGFDEDLRSAGRLAVGDMVDFLVAAKGLSEEEAYALCSIAGDLAVTQVVNINQGIHVRMPKALFAASR